MIDNGCPCNLFCLESATAVESLSHAKDAICFFLFCNKNVNLHDSLKSKDNFPLINSYINFSIEIKFTITSVKEVIIQVIIQSCIKGERSVDA